MAFVHYQFVATKKVVSSPIDLSRTYRDYGQQFDKMEGVDVAFGYWSKSLANLCEISHDDVKRIVCELTQTTKNAIGKGYKFFWDSYIHNLEGTC